MADSPPPSPPKKPPRRIPAATAAPEPAPAPPAPDWRELYGATGDSPKKNVWRSEPRPRGGRPGHAGGHEGARDAKPSHGKPRGEASRGRPPDADARNRPPPAPAHGARDGAQTRGGPPHAAPQGPRRDAPQGPRRDAKPPGPRDNASSRGPRRDAPSHRQDHGNATPGSHRHAPSPARDRDDAARRAHRDASPRPANRPGPAAERMPRGAERPSSGSADPGAHRVPPSEFVGPPRPDQRLSKVLADRGHASRREADEWIEAGWVKVDGVVATLGARVLPHQVVEVDPAARMQQLRRVTILVNKPVGYVSGQAEDGYEPASVLVTEANHWSDDPVRLKWNAAHGRGLAPAGRLDIDSTGLLVLTQDGRVARHLIGDDSDVEKEYLVRVEYPAGGRLPEAALGQLRHGLSLDGHALRPAKVSWANEDQLRFVLREGRKRQIRRMCEMVGLVVTGLKRVRIGSVALGPLPPGRWRYLREDERF